MNTLKDNIKYLLDVISKEWLEQINMKVALNSKRNTLEEQIASGHVRYEGELQEVEDQLDALSLSHRFVSKAKERIHALLGRLGSEIEYTRTQEITYGDKTIYEDKYQINGEINVTKRTLIKDGRKYIFQKVVFGDEKEPYATVKVGNENGEVTYRDVRYGGTDEVMKTTLGYDKVVDANTGVEKQVRNPKKDRIISEINIPGKGKIRTEDGAICDARGHLIGSHHFYEEDLIGAEARTIVDEKKYKDKSGKEVIFRQEISSIGDSKIIKRTDYVNGEMATQILFNKEEGFLVVTNYRDGKKANWGRYELQYVPKLKNEEFTEYYGWKLKAKKYYDESGIEIDEEELTEDEKIIPSHIGSRKEISLSHQDILSSPMIVLGGSYAPTELLDLIGQSFYYVEASVNYVFAQSLEKLDIEELNNSRNKTR